jgi:hypothetical protein
MAKRYCAHTVVRRAPPMARHAREQRTFQISHSRAAPGAPDVLDPSAAQTAAASYIAQVYPDLKVTADADEQHLVVIVTQQVAPTFLQLVHISTVQVEARAEASPRGGINQAVT